MSQFTSQATTQVIQKLKLPKRFEAKLFHDIDYLLTWNQKEQKDLIDQIILFGSCARGSMRVNSDIDLLVITSEELTRMERGTIASELEEAIDEVHTDCIFYTREQFDSSTRVIVQQIKKDGICLYERMV